jgi:hypothetical protein
MADTALPLRGEDEPVELLPDPLAPVEEGVSWGDYGRAVTSGGYGLGAGVSSAVQYATGAEEDSIAARMRRWFEEGADAETKKMSAAAQRAISASVLPGQGSDIWDKDVAAGSAIGLKVASSLPSLAASLIPGGLAARLAVAGGASVAAAAGIGTAVGGAAAGVQTAGDVFEDIQRGILEMPDEELQKESPTYAGFRSMGFTEDEAKRRITEKAAGFKPVYMAALTALTSKYGVEGLVASRAAGRAGVAGLARRAGGAALGEGLQEAGEEGAASALTQAGEAEATDDEFELDYQRALSAAAEGFVVGGVLGGTVGAVSGHGAAVDPDDREALKDPSQQHSEPPPMVLKNVGRKKRDHVDGARVGSELEAAKDAN